MSEVVNKPIVEGFVKKMSTSWVNRFFVALREALFSDRHCCICLKNVWSFPNSEHTGNSPHPAPPPLSTGKSTKFDNSMWLPWPTSLPRLKQSSWLVRIYLVVWLISACACAQLGNLVNDGAFWVREVKTEEKYVKFKLKPFSQYGFYSRNFHTSC